MHRCITLQSYNQTRDLCEKNNSAYIDMTASIFRNVVFRNCEFDCIIVEEASYINVEFQNCKMQCIDFTSSKIEEILLVNCEMKDLYFSDEQIE